MSPTRIDSPFNATRAAAVQQNETGINPSTIVQQAVAWSTWFNIDDPSTIKVLSTTFTEPRGQDRRGTFSASVRLPDGREFDVTGGYTAPPFPTQWLETFNETTPQPSGFATDSFGS